MITRKMMCDPIKKARRKTGFFEWQTIKCFPMENRNTAKEITRKVALAGVFAALVFVATELHVPTALGYIHLGDGVILYAGYASGPAAVSLSDSC